MPPGFRQRKDGHLSLRWGCALLMSPKDGTGMGSGISIAAAGLTDTEPSPAGTWAAALAGLPRAKGATCCRGGSGHLCRSPCGGGDASQWVWLPGEQQ